MVGLIWWWKWWWIWEYFCFDANDDDSLLIIECSWFFSFGLHLVWLFNKNNPFGEDEEVVDVVVVEVVEVVVVVVIIIVEEEEE